MTQPPGHDVTASTMAVARNERTVPRGLAASVATHQLRYGIWLRGLSLANRFRVVRTIDIAAACFPERTFKAALTAAQRAMRGMVKAQLLARYRTDRFQTVYGLTKRGADWLEDQGVHAASSVRRVSDMRNPEHRLWFQLLVIASEARGLRAWTESEVLRELHAGATGAQSAQGMLAVSWTAGGRTARQNLRPDAVALEPDGVTWFEADISKRGTGREAALTALARSVGTPLAFGGPLRRVVVCCKSERIRKRAEAVMSRLMAEMRDHVLVGSRVHLRSAEEGVYEVWRGMEQALADGRVKVEDKLVGHVVVQQLPVWLPKLRLEDGDMPIVGWFADGALPYRRPASCPGWQPCRSPLLSAVRTGTEGSGTKSDRTRGE